MIHVVFTTLDGRRAVIAVGCPDRAEEAMMRISALECVWTASLGPEVEHTPEEREFGKTLMRLAYGPPPSWN